MKRIITVLILALFASICAAQPITFSGALLIGRIESSGTGSPLSYDPSQEFNTLFWPVGFSADSDDVATLTGSALQSAGNGSIAFVSPAGDWQLDIKTTAAGDVAYTGLVIQGWSFLAVDQRYVGESYFFLGKYESAQTATSTIDTAYFQVIKTGTDLVFKYSTDGSTFTELEPNVADEVPTAPDAIVGTMIELTTSPGAGTATVDIDYIRFTAP